MPQDGIPLPVDPRVLLRRVDAERSSLLKSAMTPGVLHCEVGPLGGDPSEKRAKKIMVKEGDDLRQDQLVLQLIILMDSIFKRYGVDLQLTPYQVMGRVWRMALRIGSPSGWVGRSLPEVRSTGSLIDHERSGLACGGQQVIDPASVLGGKPILGAQP